jgi:hypothetical protein
VPDTLPFAEVWLADFEFVAVDGENPDPVCVVAHELRSGRKIRVWQDELRRMSGPPYPTGANAGSSGRYPGAPRISPRLAHAPLRARLGRRARQRRGSIGRQRRMFHLMRRRGAAAKLASLFKNGAGGDYGCWLTRR